MSDRDIREAIEYLSGTNKQDRIFLLDANVDSVDETNRTCVCTMIGGNSANTLDNVRLMASVDDGILNLPALDSTVTIILSTFTEPVIIAYSELDKIKFRGGDLGGLVIVGQLVERINKIENLLNNFITAYNSHTHPETGTTTGITPMQESQTATLTQISDIENVNITQG